MLPCMPGLPTTSNAKNTATPPPASHETHLMDRAEGGAAGGGGGDGGGGGAAGGGGVGGGGLGGVSLLTCM